MTSQTQFASFAQALAPAQVSYEHLRKHYKPFLQLALRFLGVMAHCYPYMEIWPTSFRSYNLMLPNLMEFPSSLFGSPSIGLRGLGMYASSRAANCMYCSAHCCAVGIRGGLDENKLKRAMSPGDVHTPGERALIQVANGMSTVPATLCPEDVRELEQHFNAAEVDGLVLSIVMMGFLNKMMDAMGFNLEEGVVKAVEEVASASGWASGRHEVVSTGREKHPSKRPWTLWLSMVPHMPAAVLADSRWTRGVPSSADQATPWLVERTGYAFPMITAARQKRIIRTMSTMVRDNLDLEVSEVGAGTKQLAGVIYSAGLGNEELVRGARLMTQKAFPGASAELLDRLVALASQTIELDDPSVLPELEKELAELAGPKIALNETQLAAILLAKSMSPSPAVVPPTVVQLCVERMSPAAVIELVTWFSVLSMLHRYEVYQAAQTDKPSAGG